jgi:hypothetical protein
MAKPNDGAEQYAEPDACTHAHAHTADADEYSGASDCDRHEHAARTYADSDQHYRVADDYAYANACPALTYGYSDGRQYADAGADSCLVLQQRRLAREVPFVPQSSR